MCIAPSPPRLSTPRLVGNSGPTTSPIYVPPLPTSENESPVASPGDVQVPNPFMEIIRDTAVDVISTVAPDLAQIPNVNDVEAIRPVVDDAGVLIPSQNIDGSPLPPELGGPPNAFKELFAFTSAPSGPGAFALQIGGKRFGAPQLKIR